MNEKYQKLKRSGFKLTPQRMAVIDFLEGNTSHPAINDIYTALVRKYPSLSRATVYNTVDALVKAGLLSELAITKDKSNYDPNVNPHDHAYCMQCGKIYDMPGQKTETKEQVSVIGDFKVTSVQRVYYGCCSKCS
jgi:Fur family transcriptional regulator, peroxide stress response regulator